jgi:hypothetical protein
MPSTRIEIKLRPLKFAVIVNPNDQQSVIQAIQLNSFLWGGDYNPIIPKFKRVPKYWDDLYSTSPKGSSILKGYINNFDPDFLVPICNDKIDASLYENRREVTIDDILRGSNDSGIPRIGVGLFEILHSFFQTELKFVRKNPLHFKIPKYGGKYSLFFSSVFGMLTPEQVAFFHENFDESLDAEWVDCDFNNYFSFFENNNYFFRRITNHQLHENRNRLQQGLCIFYFNAANVQDIIDYWNLRAVGRQVFPVPIQADNTNSLKDFLIPLIKDNYAQDPRNPNNYQNVVLIKSRSLRENDAQKFIEELNLPLPPNSQHQYLSYQSWYPQIWNERATDHDETNCCNIEARRSTTELLDIQNELNFKALSPEFMLDVYSSEPRYANGIEIRNYGNRELVAEVIPECNEFMLSAIGGYGTQEWRFSKKSIVYLSSKQDQQIYLHQPLAEKVVSAWLRSKDVETTFSTSGLTAKQMLMQLNGIYGTNWLSDEELVRFLNDMSNGKPMIKPTFFAQLNKIAHTGKRKRNIKNMLQGLMKTEMFRLGLELQCPTCNQYSWYSLEAIKYQLQCEKCLSKFDIPSYSPDDIRWSYRTIGPFSLSKHTIGVYPVLLTLRFFSIILHAATSPLLSSEFHYDNKKIEVDLTLLLRESVF